MSRKLRASGPISRELLKLSVPDFTKIKARDKNAKDHQKHNYDKRHRAKRKSLKPGNRVWMPDRETEAHVQRQVAPRSFELITNDGVTVRRNQSSVHRLPEKSRHNTHLSKIKKSTHSKMESLRTKKPKTPEPAEPETPAEPTPVEQHQPTKEQPPLLRTSSRARKPRERWEPQWTSERQNSNR